MEGTNIPDEYSSRGIPALRCTLTCVTNAFDKKKISLSARCRARVLGAGQLPPVVSPGAPACGDRYEIARCAHAGLKAHPSGAAAWTCFLIPPRMLFGGFTADSTYVGKCSGATAGKALPDGGLRSGVRGELKREGERESIREGESSWRQEEAAIKPAPRRRVGRDVFKTYSSIHRHTHTINKYI